MVFEYKETTGRPYIADMLGSPILYDNEISNKEMDMIDDWVMLEIERRGLNGRTESYKEVIDDLCEKMEMSKTIAPREKVKRLAMIIGDALGIQKKYKELGIDLQSLERIRDDLRNS